MKRVVLSIVLAATCLGCLASIPWVWEFVLSAIGHTDGCKAGCRHTWAAAWLTAPVPLFGCAAGATALVPEVVFKKKGASDE